MTYVGIDSSIASTALCVESDGVERFYNFTTAEKLSAWMRAAEPAVEYCHLLYNYPDEYSDSECYKILSYKRTADDIVAHVPDGSIVGMESYSQSSDAGRLLDLCCLGTFIRWGLLSRGIELHLYAPMTLKKETCRMAYNNLVKKIWRNPAGVAGGSFKKPEMLMALRDSGRDSALIKASGDRFDDMLALKAVPKPFDDVVDAFWAKELVKDRHVKRL